MRRALLCLALTLLLALPCASQIAQLALSAGSPEDNALQTALNETDAAKRIALLTEFVQKFAANPVAAAYGNLQLAQQYQGAGDLKNAMTAAENAYQAVPNNLEILVAAASIAQAAKDNGKAVQYAVKGAALINGLEKQPRPEGIDEAAWAQQLATQRSNAQSSYEFLEAAAYNAIAQEQDARLRMGYIDQFSPAFPKSRYAEAVSQHGIYSLQQMNDTARLAEYGEKALAADPNNVGTLVMLANAFAEEQSMAHAEKALQYARRALELAKGEDPGAAQKDVLAAGVAHSAIGWVLMKQEKTPAAISELQQAARMLKRDATSYAMVLYRLAYAYAKTGKLPEARTTLNELLAMNSPYQAAARELLQKVNAPRPGPRAK